MLKIFSRIIFFVLVSILLVVIQFSLISALPGWGKYLYPGVVVSVFIIFFFDLLSAFYFIFLFGLLLDILSFQFFGMYTTSLALSALASYLILKKFLTNKSIYSLLAVMLIFIFSYNFLFSFFSFIFTSSSFQIFQSAFWISLLIQFFWGIICTIIFFPPLVSWFKKFKPFFLEKR